MPKTVFITGICGFLGSNVAKYFHDKGDTVLGIDNMTKYEIARTSYNVEKARNYTKNLLEKQGIRVIVDDIRNLEVLYGAVKGADYIIHTAAQPAMTLALTDPFYDASVNIMGTLNVLEVARNHGIPMVSCSSIHTYGNGINAHLKDFEGTFHLKNHTQGINEDTHDSYHSFPLLSGEITPLHVSKVTTENYVRAYHESYGLKCATFRLSGMAGRNQTGSEDHGFLANFCIRTIMGYPIRIFGNDSQVRDVLYAMDVANAFELWFSAGCPSSLYNIGGGVHNATSIGQFLGIIKDVTGIKPSITLEPARKGDLWYFVADYSKAKSDFGWEPKTHPKEIVKHLAGWVNSNKELFVKD
jgi:CDP-paratose 2-epimerase